MRLSDNREIVDEILEQLKENKEQFGERYCPCVPSCNYNNENAKDYICPCKNFREQISCGEECHCGLYIKD